MGRVVPLLLLAACARTSHAEPPNDAAPAPAASTFLAVIDASARAEATDPFGLRRDSPKAGCSALAGHVADPDQKASFVDGDDLLAIVNRSPTGLLAPDWAPSDLVDIQTGKPASPSDCEKVQA